MHVKMYKQKHSFETFEVKNIHPNVVEILHRYELKHNVVLRRTEAPLVYLINLHYFECSHQLVNAIALISSRYNGMVLLYQPYVEFASRNHAVRAHYLI